MISGVHHIALRTKDLARLEQFYIEVLGLSEQARDGDRCVWIGVGNTLLMLEAASENEPHISSRTRELIAYTIAPDMRSQCRDRLTARGVVIEEETRFTFYFRDPDGRRLALSHYPHDPKG